MKYKNLAVLVLLIGTISLFGEEVQFDDVMMDISKSYLEIHSNLSSDLEKGNVELAKQILPFVEVLRSSKISDEHLEHYKSIPDNLNTALAQFLVAKDIKGQRNAFRELSKPMAMWASMANPEGLNVVYCSMSPGSWLQKDKEILNPYFGASMLHCGEIISSRKENSDMKMEQKKHNMHNK